MLPDIIVRRGGHVAGPRRFGRCEGGVDEPNRRRRLWSCLGLRGLSERYRGGMERGLSLVGRQPNLPLAGTGSVASSLAAGGFCVGGDGLPSGKVRAPAEAGPEAQAPP